MAQSCRKAVLTITSIQAGKAEVDNFWECAMCFSVVVLCESLKNGTGILWKGRHLHWKLEGGCCTGSEFPGASFSLQCIWCLPVFVPTSNSSVCLCSGLQNTWLCRSRGWNLCMEILMGLFNQVLRCFHALGLCYQHSDAVFAGICSLLDARAYFRVQEYTLSSDSMRGACHGSIPTCHMIRNYCNTAENLMIITSLGLSYHCCIFY